MKSRPSASLFGLRVLIVDDDVELRLVMRWMLEARGAMVSEARTGCEALDHVRRRRFDVVLTDLCLPDMAGETIVDALRVSTEMRTPIAVVSGDDSTSLGRAREVGAERTFHKPVDWEDLMLYLGSKRSTGGGNQGVSTKAAAGMTVLVIEDDPEMRALLCDALEVAGYRPVARPDGRDLTALAELEHFDVVVLDKQLPGPSGLDLLSFLHKRVPAVPVILITAFGGPAVAEEAANLGAYSYLEKPFRMTAILATLAGVARRQAVKDTRSAS
jgi:DNA-binding response OmpR family regulator